jgi:malate dehydrogenase
LVDSIVNDQKKMIPCSVLVEGEYGLTDLCIGVPCIIGAKGVEAIVDVQLNDKEQALLQESASKVRAMNEALDSLL